MFPSSCVLPYRTVLAVAVLVFVSFASPALNIISGPTLIPAPHAPLAARIELVTDGYSRVSLTIDDGDRSWRRDFYDYAQWHSVPVLGLRAGRENLITVTVIDRFGNAVEAGDPVGYFTGPLPADFPVSVLMTSKPDRMEPGYTLSYLNNRAAKRGYTAVIDAAGEVVWYTGLPAASDVRQMANGNLFFPLNTNFYELNFLGETVANWNAPTNLPINIHDGVPTDHGTILYLSDASRVVTNLPGSATDSNAPVRSASVLYNRVVEISATNAEVLNVWSPIDLLDPARVDYLSLTITTALGYDVEHSNALLEDPRDDSIVVSMRHQDAVVKFSRQTGQLKWILGPHANWGPAWQPFLLNPVGDPFEWNYAQHAPILTESGTWLLYDDGVKRASPFDPALPDSSTYSRAVEFRVDEARMEVSQVWDYGRTNLQRFYTPIVGSTYQLPETGNVLINYGSVSLVNGFPVSAANPNATMVVIQEVTHTANPEVVFQLVYFDYSPTEPSYLGYNAYRSRHIPDLYPVLTPGGALAELAMSVQQTGRRSARVLMPFLASALNGIGRQDVAAARRWLEKFQSRLLAARVDPPTANVLFYQAESILDALEAGRTVYATERLTSEYPLFEPLHGLAGLVDSVAKANPKSRRALVQQLCNALGSMKGNDTRTAVRGLRAFQRAIRSARLESSVADNLWFQAQHIVNALEG
ncbi:MAG: aryl-sulfate sulfotransferase [Verrucomicrobiota bacterium]